MKFKNFPFKKPALAIAASGVVLSLHMGLQAQTNSDASVSIGGQIAVSTCSLVTARNASQLIGGTRNYSFGTTNSISANAKAVDEVIVSGSYAVTISLSTPDGQTCNLPGTWDVGLDIASGDYVTTPSGGTYLISKGDNSPQGVGLRLQSGLTTIGRSNLDLSRAVPPYGILLSNRASRSLNLATNEAITLLPSLVRTSASAITEGSFSVSLPLNIWYK